MRYYETIVGTLRMIRKVVYFFSAFISDNKSSTLTETTQYMKQKLPDTAYNMPATYSNVQYTGCQTSRQSSHGDLLRGVISYNHHQTIVKALFILYS